MLAASGISASPSIDNMWDFNVMILGPSQSPYEGTSITNEVIIFFQNCDYNSFEVRHFVAVSSKMGFWLDIFFGIIDEVMG